MDKTCEVDLNSGGYEETIMFYVAHLSGWDMIHGKTALQVVRGTMSASAGVVTMQPSGMDRFFLCMWRGNRVIDRKTDLPTAANSILTRVDKLALRPAERENEFNPVAEFAVLFTMEIAVELQPMWPINDKIDVISVSSCIPTYRLSGDKFRQEITLPSVVVSSHGLMNIPEKTPCKHLQQVLSRNSI